MRIPVAPRATIPGMAEEPRILSIDCRFADPRVTGATFAGAETALGHDLVIWDARKAPHSYGATEREINRGDVSLTDAELERFQDDVARRSVEFHEHLEEGRPIVVLVPPPMKLRELLNIGSPFYLEGCLPVPLSLERAQGSGFDLVAGEPFLAFWKKNEAIFAHEAYIEAPPGTPLLTIRGTRRVVATAAHSGAGVVLCLPRFAGEFYDADVLEKTGDGVEAEEAAHTSFLDDLLTLLGALGPETVLPPWTDSYQVPGEAEAISGTERARRRVRQAETDLRKSERSLEEVRERKLLFSGTGASLENIVAEALTAIGFEVDMGPPGRSDLTIWRGRRVAVVEVKGVSRSAAEKHAAQLEKWVNSHHAEHGKQPKGILVVNTWRNTPLSEREGRTHFPQQMLKFAAEERGHCLITGVQLLGLWLEVDRAPSRKARIANELLSCVGPFTRFASLDELAIVEVESRRDEEG